jgi:hypothetical protein
MATAFDGAGMGMFGREAQFTKGGPVNELVKLLPAAGLAYGLVKSGAVGKLNAQDWMSNPTKALGNAITGSAPAPAGADGNAVVPAANAQTQNGTVITTDLPPSDYVPAAKPSAAPAPSGDDLVNHVIGDNSGVTPDLLNNDAQRQDSNAVLQMASASADRPNNQPSQDASGGGGSAISTFLTLAKLFA